MNKYKIEGISNGISTIWFLKKRVLYFFWITVEKGSLEYCTTWKECYESRK